MTGQSIVSYQKKEAQISYLETDKHQPLVAYFLVQGKYWQILTVVQSTGTFPVLGCKNGCLSVKLH